MKTMIPMAVALAKTDRSEQEDIVVAEPNQYPQTHLKMRGHNAQKQSREGDPTSQDTVA